MSTFDDMMAELQSGDTPEELIAGMIALRDPMGAAGQKWKHFDRFEGEQYHMAIAGLCKGDFYESIHVSDDSALQCRIKFKKALVEAARRLATTPIDTTGGTR